MGPGAIVLLILLVVFALIGIALLIFGNKRVIFSFNFPGGGFTTQNAGGLLIGVALVMVIILVPSGLLGTSTGNPGSGPTATTQGGGTHSSGTIPPGSPDVTTQVETAFNSFCQALRNNQLETAFGDLTPGYQQSVGSPANLPNAVGGTDLQIQETASDCSVFAQPNINPDNQEAVELGTVVVTDSTFGTQTIARNFAFVLTNGAWLINNIYAQ
jgi:hypothetical protein